MNYAFLVCVLNRVTKLDEKLKTILKRQLVRGAILSDPNAANQFHHKKRTAHVRRAAVQNTGNARMIHEG